MAPRGNDAIPSWSGFNYQGKMTLLVSLIEINALLSQGKSLDNCYVEIEKTEDFIIYIHGVAVGLYQVKAYLAQSCLSTYTRAMQKLLDHRIEIQAHGADCFFCTPLEIQKWDEESNAYQNVIKIFKYKNEHVHVIDAPNVIKEVLSRLLENLNLSKNRIFDLYLGLCQMLDENISRMHNEYFKERNYNIKFNDIVNFLKESYTNYIVTEELREKEKIYEYIVGNIKDIVDNYCENDCPSIEVCELSDLRDSCALPRSYDYILEIDIWKYCKYLNPHHANWDSQYDYINRLNTDTIRNLLVPIFSLISTDSLFRGDGLIYCDSDIYQTTQNRVIPTLLSFPQLGSRDVGSDIDRAASSLLQRIKNNTFLSSSSIMGSTITGDTGGRAYGTDKKSILHFDSSEDEVKQKITNNENTLNIVDFQDFRKRIGD